ncbi:MAG: mechanosensitive ion channel [Candidatus Eremiobacteraeota bacterium]|nr:mechanosensitive ion channel [Candidatus Eremiobacteraeota bacterium]
MNLSAINLGEALTALSDKLQAWLNGLVLMLPNLVMAIVTLFAFVLIARIVGGVVQKATARASSYRALNSLAATVARIVIIAVGAFLALGILGLDKTVTSLLAGAGVVGLALAFAFQDIAGNFMSGVLLAVRRPFKVGDLIESNDFFGTVREINLRDTLLETPQGQRIIIPNSSVIQNPIENYNNRAVRRVDLECGVAYGDSLEEAEKVALGALEGLDFVKADIGPQFFYTGFGGSSIDFKLRFWIDFAKQSDFMKARSLAIVALKNAFDEAGITIPFPITTLDFDVVGGRTLSREVDRIRSFKNGELAKVG